MTEREAPVPWSLHGAKGPPPPLVALGLLGVLSHALALWTLQPFQFLVSNYTTVPVPRGDYWMALAFAVGVFLCLIALALWVAGPAPLFPRCQRAISLFWPLLLSLPLACYAFTDRVPPFLLSHLFILATGWTAFHVVRSQGKPIGFQLRHSHALLIIIALIAVLTVVHTKIQIHFFHHFMLGHADIGHFTEELKNALAGRGLRCDSFENTRLGWHFAPLMYVLAPGYALWPSPFYLMVLSALICHSPAIPIYSFARRLTGDLRVGVLCAAAWLLLPSTSRLVYGNTYGFQWNNVTLLLIILMVSAGITARWRWSFVGMVLLLLARETAAAATFGWAMYLFVFTHRRKWGAMIAGVSVLYFLLCAYVLIPHFAAAERFERMDVFGQLGRSPLAVLGSAIEQPGEFWGRLFRVEGWFFLAILIVPMALLPLAGWRLASGALPTLIPLLLVENSDWIGIKFWHHAGILPFLFLAGITTMRVPHTLREASGTGTSTQAAAAPGANDARSLALAMALLICAAGGHYLYGFSPISKPYEPVANDPFLQQPDPRLAFVRQWRERISHDRSILATERLAAHFTDYRRLYTGRRNGAVEAADYVLIDTSDSWDMSGLPQRAGEFVSHPYFELVGHSDPIFVFARRSDVPTKLLD